MGLLSKPIDWFRQCTASKFCDLGFIVSYVIFFFRWQKNKLLLMLLYRKTVDVGES